MSRALIDFKCFALRAGCAWARVTCESMMAPKEKRAEKSAMTVATIFRPETKQQLPKKGRISLFISMLPSTNHWTQPRRC